MAAERGGAMLVGAHESIAGGVWKALERGEKDGCEVVQIFNKNPRGWKASELSGEDVEKFKEAREKTGMEKVVSHLSYLPNLATSKKGVREKSIKDFILEMKRCEKLGLDQLIFHPGHPESMEEGIGLVAQAIDEMHEETKGKVKTVIEISAGQGTDVGESFENIAAIIDRVGKKKRVGVCFDTCHAFVAGYDIRTEKAQEKTFDSFEETIGLERLVSFHLNDAKEKLGSKVDRHDHVGEGRIGREAFRLLMKDKRFEKTPGFLETPPYEDGSSSYPKGLELLKSFRK